MRSLLACLLLVGCVDDASEMPTDPNQLRGDDKSDGGAPLWAGLTSVTLERYSSDPCGNGRSLGDDPIHYDDWVRQRAGVRNICFQVWSPGITDWDNPDFWKQLDVQVHVRFGDGEWQHRYVDSVGRSGNNRRYAWSIDYALDPLSFAWSIGGIKVPFTIESETESYARVAADMQVYFTVNGRVLNAPSDRSFVVRYEGQARKPSLAVSETGYVLHDIVTCADGSRFGSGAGFFAADIRSPAAIADLGAGLDGSMIYGVPTMRASSVLSFTYGSQIPFAGESLPGFSDSGGVRIVPDGTSMRVELSAYDRALGRVRALTTTVGGCVAGATN